eukprot:TRINITY_DN980_c0_g2_i1.p1 TRINITY_DN980_c0_g2~~TRINITY_DN980_c0_g2_i1.p1  ORF type:complete len:1161 (+),score=354.03 TRINITY_DN980_c0_g2_i1:113-3595(+)
MNIEKLLVDVRPNQDRAFHAGLVTTTQGINAIIAIVSITLSAVGLSNYDLYPIKINLIGSIINLLSSGYILLWSLRARRTFQSTPEPSVQDTILRNSFTADLLAVVNTGITLADLVICVFYRQWFDQYLGANNSPTAFWIIFGLQLIQTFFFGYAAFATYIAAPGERTLRRILAFVNAAVCIIGIVVVYYTHYVSSYSNVLNYTNIAQNQNVNLLWWSGVVAIVLSLAGIFFILRRLRLGYLIYAIIILGVLLLAGTAGGFFLRNTRQAYSQVSPKCYSNIAYIHQDFLQDKGCSNKYVKVASAYSLDCPAEQQALVWENDIGVQNSAKIHSKSCLNYDCCRPLSNAILDPYAKLGTWAIYFIVFTALAFGASILLFYLRLDEGVIGRGFELLCFGLQGLFLIAFLLLILFGLPQAPAINNDNYLPINRSNNIKPVPPIQQNENPCIPFPGQDTRFKVVQDNSRCTSDCSIVAIAKSADGDFRVDPTCPHDVNVLSPESTHNLFRNSVPSATEGQIGVVGERSQVEAFFKNCLRVCINNVQAFRAPSRQRLENADDLEDGEEDDDEVTNARQGHHYHKRQTTVPQGQLAIHYGTATVPNVKLNEKIDKISVTDNLISVPIDSKEQFIVRGRIVKPTSIKDIDVDDDNIKPEGLPEQLDWETELIDVALDDTLNRGNLLPPIKYDRKMNFVLESLRSTLTYPAETDIGTSFGNVVPTAGRTPPAPYGQGNAYNIPNPEPNGEFILYFSQLDKKAPYTVLLRAQNTETTDNAAETFLSRPTFYNFTVGGYPLTNEINLGTIVLDPLYNFPNFEGKRRMARTVKKHSKLTLRHKRSRRQSTSTTTTPEKKFSQIIMPYGEVSAIVYDATTNQTIPNATIELYGTTSNQYIFSISEWAAIVDRTNSSGSVALQTIPQGAAIIRASFPGYHPTWKVIHVNYKKYLVSLALSPIIQSTNQLRTVLEWKSSVLNLDLFVTFNVQNAKSCEVSHFNPYCVGTQFENQNNVGGQNGSESILINELGQYNYLFFVAPGTAPKGVKNNNTRVAELNNNDNKVTNSFAQVRVYTNSADEATYTFEVPGGGSLLYTKDYKPLENIPTKKKADGKTIVDETKLIWLAFCMKGDIGPRSIVPLNRYWPVPAHKPETPTAEICDQEYARKYTNTVW